MESRRDPIEISKHSAIVSKLQLGCGWKAAETLADLAGETLAALELQLGCGWKAAETRFLPGLNIHILKLQLGCGWKAAETRGLLAKEDAGLLASIGLRMESRRDIPARIRASLP